MSPPTKERLGNNVGELMLERCSRREPSLTSTEGTTAGNIPDIPHVFPSMLTFYELKDFGSQTRSFISGLALAPAPERLYRDARTEHVTQTSLQEQ